MSQELQTHTQIDVKPTTGVTDSITEQLKAILRQKGEHCSQCKHLILIDHDNGKCTLCDCVRVRQFKKRPFSVSVLFQMEAGQ